MKILVLKSHNHVCVVCGHRFQICSGQPIVMLMHADRSIDRSYRARQSRLRILANILSTKQHLQSLCGVASPPGHPIARL